MSFADSIPVGPLEPDLEAGLGLDIFGDDEEVNDNVALASLPLLRVPGESQAFAQSEASLPVPRVVARAKKFSYAMRKVRANFVDFVQTEFHAYIL